MRNPLGEVLVGFLALLGVPALLYLFFALLPSGARARAAPRAHGGPDGNSTGARAARRSSMLKCLALVPVLALTVASCSAPPRVVGETPTMVSVCGPTWQSVVDTAQRSCSAKGKSATLIGDPGSCAGGWSKPEPLGNFRCE